MSESPKLHTRKRLEERLSKKVSLLDNPVVEVNTAMSIYKIERWIVLRVLCFVNDISGGNSGEYIPAVEKE